MEPDYYDVLKVARSSSREEIKASYRREVREHHPDAVPAGPAKDEAHQKIQLIIAAWTTLSDPTARAAYDERLRRAHIQAQQLPEPEADAPYVPGSRGGSMPRERDLEAEGRKRNRVQAVMGGGQAPRATNPRTRLLAMVFDAAQLYHVEGRAEDAARVCRDVLRLDPTNAEAAVLLSDIYTAAGKRSAALDLLERALRLQPSNVLYRSKWEALRHTTGASNSSGGSSPAASTRGGSANPWAKAPVGGPLASRIAERPPASPSEAAQNSTINTPTTSTDPVPSEPQVLEEPPPLASLEDHSNSDSVQDVELKVEQKAEQPSVPALDRREESPRPESRSSLLQRLRSKLSR